MLNKLEFQKFNTTKGLKNYLPPKIFLRFLTPLLFIQKKVSPRMNLQIVSLDTFSSISGSNKGARIGLKIRIENLKPLNIIKWVYIFHTPR